MPCFLITSATFDLSASRTIRTRCSSVNRLTFIARFLRRGSFVTPSWSNFPGAGHLALRQSRTAALMEQFGHWLGDQTPKPLPQGPMGKAIRYAIDNWREL